MKLKKQLKIYLRNAVYRSSLDFEAICRYCHKEYGIKSHDIQPAIDRDNPNAIGCSDFTDWIDTGFAPGDAVEWGGNIGIVQSQDGETLKICLRMADNSILSDFCHVNVSDIRKAGENALKCLYSRLASENRQFSFQTQGIIDRCYPKPGDMVSFTDWATMREGGAVIREITPDHRVICYCYKIDGEERPHYNLHEDLGSSLWMDFEPCRSSDYPIKPMREALKQEGVEWKHRFRRIEPFGIREEPGNTYWYVTDKLSVKSEIDRGRPKDSDHYAAGNYFLTYEAAQRAAELFRETLREEQYRVATSPKSDK